MSNVRLLLCVFLLCVVSCAQREGGGEIPAGEDGRGDVKNAAGHVGNATGFSFTAQKEVTDAQAQIVRAKLHLAETEVLVEDMRRNKSRYVSHLTNLKEIFTEHINVIERHLIKTGSVLRSQIVSLNKASKDLEVARAKLTSSEKERKALRNDNVKLKDELTKAEKYKEKYHKLQKYKWIVWGLGAWILIKFLGGLGAWSPQGRIAKALIG